MTLEIYLVFVGASIVLCIVPGPDMMFLLTRSVAQGTKAGLMAALGINLGGYVHLAAAVLGLSAVLATSPYAFAAVKFAGAGYLIYLGVRALVSENGPLPLNPDGLARHGRSEVFWQGFVSDALNPKVAIFFAALLPQFVVAHGEHPVLQLLLLGVTVNIIALTINCCLALLSGRVTRVFRQNDAIARWLHKAMGVVFITLGLSLAIEKPAFSLSGSRSMQSSSIAVSCARVRRRSSQLPMPPNAPRPVPQTRGAAQSPLHWRCTMVTLTKVLRRTR